MIAALVMLRREALHKRRRVGRACSAWISKYNLIHDESARMLVEASQRGKWSVRLCRNYLTRDTRRELARRAVRFEVLWHLM